MCIVCEAKRHGANAQVVEIVQAAAEAISELAAILQRLANDGATLTQTELTLYSLAVSFLDSNGEPPPEDAGPAFIPALVWATMPAEQRDAVRDFIKDGGNVQVLRNDAAKIQTEN